MKRRFCKVILSAAVLAACVGLEAQSNLYSLHIGGCLCTPLASVPFQFGTNRLVELTQNLTVHGGTCVMYLDLPDGSLPHSSKGQPPSSLDTSLHVLVLTNGQPALDENLHRLSPGFSSPFLAGSTTNTAPGATNTTRYILASFRVDEAKIECRVQDVRGGTIRARGSLRLDYMISY